MLHFFYLPLLSDKEDATKPLLLDVSLAILSIPIISKLIANMIVKIIIPEIGCAMTIKEIAKDNIPTPIRNALDHREIFLFPIPCMILASPIKNNPTANKDTKKSAANRGNAITAIPNPIAIAPNTILPVREDFVRCGCTPTATLSIPTTTIEIESIKIKTPIPSAGSAIMATDKTIAIAPSTICAALIALNEFKWLPSSFMYCYPYLYI